jgi:Ala-tRNA(Pro) deacylase
MPVDALKTHLDENGVRYVVISHSIAYTAEDTARSAHVPEDAFAKVVMVRIDGDMAMVLLRASDKLDLHRLRHLADAGETHLADEVEFQGRFPGVEIGAMPPFGNLYGLDVYADEALARNERIAFNAGSHREIVQLAWDDFERLVQPVLGSIAMEDPAARIG